MSQASNNSVYDPAFCDAQYNNRAMVPDHAAIFARWQHDSRVARERLRASTGAQLDIAYGESPLEKLDFFPAKRIHLHTQPHRHPPLLVFIHGGYWRSLDKNDFSYIAPVFVEQGVAVAVVNYDLCPQVSIETIVRQMLTAHTWLFMHAGQWGCDPHRMYTAGHSAGGHLAAMMLAARWPSWHGTLPPDLIKGAITVSGVHDLEPLLTTPFLGGDLRLTAADIPRLSPAWMPPATHAPLVTAVGGLESNEFKRQTQLLAQRWKNVLHADVPLPDRNHFTSVDGLAEPGHALHRMALELIHLAE